MDSLQAEELEFKEDIFFGQVIIIWARWFIILGMAAAILLNVKEPRDLMLGLIPIVILMLLNFAVHGAYLMEKPVGQTIIFATSAVDLIVVSLLVGLGPIGRGFDSQLFVFYYPQVLAFTFVMRRQWAIVHTASTLLIYLLICLISQGSAQIEWREMFVRLLTLGGIGGLGSYYWRIMRSRRRAALANDSTRQ